MATAKGIVATVKDAVTEFFSPEEAEQVTGPSSSRQEGRADAKAESRREEGREDQGQEGGWEESGRHAGQQRGFRGRQEGSRASRRPPRRRLRPPAELIAPKGDKRYIPQGREGAHQGVRRRRPVAGSRCPQGGQDGGKAGPGRQGGPQEGNQEGSREEGQVVAPFAGSCPRIRRTSGALRLSASAACTIAPAGAVAAHQKRRATCPIGRSSHRCVRAFPQGSSTLRCRIRRGHWGKKLRGRSDAGAARCGGRTPQAGRSRFLRVECCCF